MIKIILADDHKLVRDGLKTLLKKDPLLDVVAEAGDGIELLKIVNEITPDVILMDITMPNLNGIDAMHQLKKINPNIKYIMLTMHEEGDYIMKSVQNGANGYLYKNADFEELQTAIKTVAEGGKYFNHKVSDVIIENLSRPVSVENENQAELTLREIEVLKEVAAGLSTKLIADKLSISTRTVETHRVNMMKKLEAHNTAELVKKALLRKLI